MAGFGFDAGAIAAEGKKRRYVCSSAGSSYRKVHWNWIWSIKPYEPAENY